MWGFTLAVCWGGDIGIMDVCLGSLEELRYMPAMHLTEGDCGPGTKASTFTNQPDCELGTRASAFTNLIAPQIDGIVQSGTAVLIVGGDRGTILLATMPWKNNHESGSKLSPLQTMSRIGVHRFITPSSEWRISSSLLNNTPHLQQILQ